MDNGMRFTGPVEAGTGNLCTLVANSSGFWTKYTFSVLREPGDRRDGFCCGFVELRSAVTQVGNKQLDKKCQIFDQSKYNPHEIRISS